MLTINLQWIEYVEQCIPPSTPEKILGSVKATFYAGSLSVLTILKELQGKTPDQVNKTINDMFDEMTEFSRKIHD